jgi:hypothetical protein
MITATPPGVHTRVFADDTIGGNRWHNEPAPTTQTHLTTRREVTGAGR